MSTPAPTASAAAASGAAAYDPIALAESLASAAEKSAKLIGEFAARHAGSQSVVPGDELGLGKAFMELAAKMLANPCAARRGADEPVVGLHEPVADVDAADARARPRSRRRAGEGRQALQGTRTGRSISCSTTSSSRYLITARWLHEQVANVEGLRRADEEEGRLLHAPVHRRARAVELRADQSRGVPRDRRDRRPEPRAAACTTCSTTSSAATASSRSR